MPTQHKTTSLLDLKAVNYRAQVARTLLDTNMRPVMLMADALHQRRGGLVFLIGNGGSAATASHLANDLLKMCSFPTVCLPDMTPTVLAYMNDTGEQYMFSQPLIQFVKSGDTVIAFSCSGKSKNVIDAVQVAKDHPDLTILAFTGPQKNTLSDLADISFHARHDDIRIQEDLHLIASHNLCLYLNEMI